MFALNQSPAYGQPLLPEDLEFLGPSAAQQVEALLRSCPAHAPTRLHALPALAAQLGIGELFVKDESTRLRLGSFKALGGAYAVMQVLLQALQARLGRAVSAQELTSPELRALAAHYTVGCATDGNHGRSVAAGARFLGCRAVIFVHAGVSAQRVAAIAAFGAEVRRVEGSYDDAVAEAARVCAAQGWTVVSDTSWSGYERIPRWVSQGYTVMVQEALRELRERPAVREAGPRADAGWPTHIFVQAGVGGLAASVVGHTALTCAASRPGATDAALAPRLVPCAPRFVVVEPRRAACLFASHAAGRPVAIAPGEPTVMAMLECYEPSQVAWQVLERLVDAFMTVDEDAAIAAMCRLAEPLRHERLGPDPAIVAGESGGAGLAGLQVALADPACRAALGLDTDSRVLLFNTEGATDPQTYEHLVGRSPEDVARAG